MLNVHPDLYLRMIEQDRERAIAQRALERAARGGSQKAPTTARGGISLITGALRQAGTALTHLHPGSWAPTRRPQGSPGA